MIGDKVFLDSDIVTGMGGIPLATANKVQLNKVNQDGFSSEYRMSATDGRYSVRIRNTVEAAKANLPAYDRHNLEIVYTQYADLSNPLSIVPERVYNAYFVYRIPAGGDPDIAKGLMGVLAGLIQDDIGRFSYLPGDEPMDYVTAGVGSLIDRMSNSES
jgi:hypothetical protein